MGIEDLKAIVDEQAEDEALWCICDFISEAYMQQELRRLHSAVEEYIADARQEQSR